MTPRSAVRVFWCGVYAPVALLAYGIVAVPTRGTVADVHPALFLPLIPAGIALLISGWFLAINYQGVREVVAESHHARVNRRMGSPYEVAGPFGAGILIMVGGLLLIGGLVAAVALLVRLF